MIVYEAVDERVQRVLVTLHQRIEVLSPASQRPAHQLGVVDCERLLHVTSRAPLPE